MIVSKFWTITDSVWDTFAEINFLAILLIKFLTQKIYLMGFLNMILFWKWQIFFTKMGHDVKRKHEKHFVYGLVTLKHLGICRMFKLSESW